MSHYPFTDEYGHRFRIDNASGPNVPDDVRNAYDDVHMNATHEAGDASEWDAWAGRIGRRVAYLDSSGMRTLTTYKDANGAALFMERLEQDYADAMGDDD